MPFDPGPKLPSWDDLHPEAKIVVQRSFAIAVLEADEKVQQINNSMRQYEAAGDRALQASAVVMLLVAQTDLMGRAMLLLSTFNPKDIEDIDTIEGAILRAELVMTD